MPDSRTVDIPAERQRRITLTQSRVVPDPIRLARYLRAPEIGPTVLFFSGGSALRKTSRVLTEYTHNSVHLVTPFDSGGSSALLREAFGMLSVGDLHGYSGGLDLKAKLIAMERGAAPTQGQLL